MPSTLFLGGSHMSEIVIHTSISKMHVALDFIGRNSAYKVTLIRRDISLLNLTQIIIHSVVFF